MVEALLGGHPLPAGRLEPDDVLALRAAIDLRVARPGADQPAEEFVTALRLRLDETGDPGEVSRSVSRLSRRTLVAGGVGAIAAGVVGAVAGGALSRDSAPHQAAPAEIVPDDGQWVPVAMVSEVANGQVRRFATETTVGFVTQQRGTLSAVSGACTHQGCLLRLNESAGRLDCPCHRTAFGIDGKLLFSRLDTLPALPRIEARSRDGLVEVLVARVE
jgi:nitrite reductase/ring-hydroxylating ferredoxin subunit